MRKEREIKVDNQVRFNCLISGLPATYLLEWKRRGIVKSNSDAIRQAFLAFHDKLVESDLKTKRLEEY